MLRNVVHEQLFFLLLANENKIILCKNYFSTFCKSYEIYEILSETRFALLTIISFIFVSPPSLLMFEY